MARIRMGTSDRGADHRTQSGGIKLETYQKPTFAGRKLIYVCGPYQPQSLDPHEAGLELLGNLALARDACRRIVNLGAVPVCPQLYLLHFLDDEVPEERELGMELALSALRRCHEVYVVSEHITFGMAREITEAAKRGIPVRMLCEPEGFREKFRDIFIGADDGDKEEEGHKDED